MCLMTTFRRFLLNVHQVMLQVYFDFHSVIIMHLYIAISFIFIPSDLLSISSNCVRMKMNLCNIH